MDHVDRINDACANKMPLPEDCSWEWDTATLEGIGEVPNAALNVELENKDLCVLTL